MPIITISRGSYSRGKEIAEKLAAKLDYKCISREVLLGTCGEYNVPEIKLNKAIRNAPSFLKQFSGGKEHYVKQIRATLLDYVQNDNIVYHGLAGQFFLKGIPNVLRVCLMVDMEYRINRVMETENMPRTTAESFLKKVDGERRKWGQRLYGIKPYSPELFDMVINLRCMTVDDAVSTIQYAANMPCFQATPESQKMLKLMTIKAQIIALLNKYPNANIVVEEDSVYVGIKAPLNQKDRIIREVTENVERIKGVTEFKVALEANIL
jgi:cytidylate kinase